MNNKPESNTESAQIFVHRSPKTTVFYLDHGESLGVPRDVIGTLGFSTLGFFLKLLALPEKDVSDMLRLYDQLEPAILESWLEDLKKAGYVWRKRRDCGDWQYVISNSVLTIEQVMDQFDEQDAELAARKRKEDGK